MKPVGKTNLMTNVLFVCSANQLRGPTAEQVFSTWPGVETDSAGLSHGATTQLSSEQIEWTDILFVMERTHRASWRRTSGRISIFLTITNSWIRF
jgi:predicted protein tyrosine phosphatase